MMKIKISDTTIRLLEISEIMFGMTKMEMEYKTVQSEHFLE